MEREERIDREGGDRTEGQDRASAYPPGPAWAVGADREHTGPSGMGPGQDRPGFGEEVDLEDAEGVTGGVMQSENR